MEIALIMGNEVRRYGVASMLGHVSGIGAVTCYGSAEEAARAAAVAFDLVVMSATDLPFPTGLAMPGLRLLLLVDGSDELDGLDEVRSCVHALIDWSGLTSTILGEAITDVVAGKFYMSAVLARRVLRQGGQSPAGVQQWGPLGTGLTPRELEVLRLVAEGLSNKQVARRLQISEHGVKRLMGNVLAKLNCPNRTLAVVRAIEHGLLVDVGAATGSATSVA